MLTLDTVLVLFAAVCLGLDAIKVTTPFNLFSLAAFFLVLTLLV